MSNREYCSRRLKLMHLNRGDIHLTLHFVDDIIGNLLFRLDVHATGVNAGLVRGPVIGACHFHNGGAVIVLATNLQVDVYRWCVRLFRGILPGGGRVFLGASAAVVAAA